MKRIILSFTTCFFMLALFFSTGVNAQELEAEKIHALSKDAKKGFLGSFTYDENAKEYTLVFVREKKKKTIYVTYKFDYEFNQMGDEIEEELTDIEASKKFDFIEFTEEPWKAPSVVRVDGDGFNTLQVTLKKGYINRRWIPASTTTVGNYTWYVPGYYKYDFEVQEKFKPQIDVDVEIDPNAPKFVVNLVNNAAKKIKLVAYQTDEPEFGVNTSIMVPDFYGKGKGSMNRIGKDKAYSEASGNILLVGYQEWAIKKEYTRRFVSLYIDAEDLQVKNESVYEFDYVYTAVKTKTLPDNSIAVVLAPAGMGFDKSNANPNTLEYYYLRIDKKANLMEKIKFESTSSFWDINDIVMAENGDVYVYGAALKEKNDKHYDKQLNTTKFDNFQLMKIADGKMAYLTSTNMDEFESKLQLPPDMKKVDSYDGKKFAVGPLTVTGGGDVFVSGQEANNGQYGNINLFQFDKDGKLKAQYGYRLEETSKEATSQATTHVEIENPDGKTLSWIIYEMNGSTEEKLLLYPRVAIIDLENAKVGEFKQYGFGKGAAYYVDNNRPIVLIDGYKKAVFFGADKKDKELWFSRVKLVE